MKKILEYFNKLVFGITIESLLNKRDELDQKIIELQSKLKQNSNIESPKVIKKITNKRIRELISPLNFNNINLSDIYYSTCSKEDAMTFQKKIGVNLKKYIPEEFDCDDFSFNSMGYWRKDLSYTYFIVWSANHAFNLFIDDKENIWIVEPQNNNFYTIEQASKFKSPDGVNYEPYRVIIG